MQISCSPSRQTVVNPHWSLNLVSLSSETHAVHCRFAGNESPARVNSDPSGDYRRRVRLTLRHTVCRQSETRLESPAPKCRAGFATAPHRSARRPHESGGRDRRRRRRHPPWRVRHQSLQSLISNVSQKYWFLCDLELRRNSM